MSKDPINLNIDGLALKETDNELASGFGETWYMYGHQKRLFDKWRKKETFFASNTAPTGAGKTHSWLKPSVELNDNVLAIFPTKPLINDQYESIYTDIKRKYDKPVNRPFEQVREENGNGDFSEEESIGVGKITRNELMKLRNKNLTTAKNQTQALKQTISSLESNNESYIILTNPDIFSMIRHNIYEDASVRQQIEGFDAIIVDEFHYSSQKGQHTLTFLLEQMRRDPRSNVDKCVLLSATPEKSITERLKSINVEFINVNRNKDRKPLSEVKNKPDWRPVLPPTKLQIRPSAIWGVGRHLISKENIAETVEFCKRKDSNAIIIDSWNDVVSIKNKLNQRLDRQVMRIDGRKRRKRIGDILLEFEKADKATLVTNSAGEVGIDYDIDQLIFAGTTPAKMEQRFGRLRNKKETVEAVTFVPMQVYERMKEFNKGGKIKRDVFINEIKSSYKSSKRPKSFPPTYSSHEAFSLLTDIRNNKTKESQQNIEETLDLIKENFFTPFNIEFDSQQFIKDHLQMDAVTNGLQKFRTDQLSVLRYDVNEDVIDTDSVYTVIQSGDVEFVDEDEFFEIIPSKFESEAKSYRRYTNGYAIWKGNLYKDVSVNYDRNPVKRKMKIANTETIDRMLTTNPEKRRPRKANGIRVVVVDKESDFPPIKGIDKLNKNLQEADPLVYAIEENDFEAKTTLNLDEYFHLTDIANINASVAFSHKALQLHCYKQEHLAENGCDYSDLDIYIPPDHKARMKQQI